MSVVWHSPAQHSTAPPFGDNQDISKKVQKHTAQRLGDAVMLDTAWWLHAPCYLLAQVSEQFSQGDLCSRDIRVVRPVGTLSDVQGHVEVREGLHQPVLRLQQPCQVDIAGSNLHQVALHLSVLSV